MYPSKLDSHYHLSRKTHFVGSEPLLQNLNFPAISMTRCCRDHIQQKSCEYLQICIMIFLSCIGFTLPNSSFSNRIIAQSVGLSNKTSRDGFVFAICRLHRVWQKRVQSCAVSGCQTAANRLV